jgi:dihydropteroate synthase
MGILNVTPDSFSDGGKHLSFTDAVEAGLRMIDDGADLIDVGGESTRPGAEPVSVFEELWRTIPVVEGLRKQGIAVSIDTTKAKVAREALVAGASVVNDITALRDAEMATVCAQAGCTVCLMHMQGEPRTMQKSPHYDDVVGEVKGFLLHAALRAESVGVAREKIWIDPGIGFGKTVEHNLTLLRNVDQFVATGYPVLIGVSLKSFLARIGQAKAHLMPVEERLSGTLAAQVLAQAAGAKIIRTHNVKEARRAMDVAEAVLGVKALGQ